jgi:hypothetical protein
MHPSSLLSYYPTYAILDEIVNYGKYKKLNIFIDLKNTLQTTYMEHAIINIVEQSKKTKFIDSSIFAALMSFLAFHKIYGLKRGIDTTFVIFFESGISYYHTNISKTYKISRRIDDLYGLSREDRDFFYSILQRNFQLIERACNMIPSIKVIRLQNLEADFVPYYLLSRKLVRYDGIVGHITYSNDHDLLQCIAKDSYIFSKSMKGKKIVKPGEVMSSYLHCDNNIPDQYLPLAMAIVGDPGDNVTGVKGIGGKRFVEIFEDLLKLTGDLKTIYEKARMNTPIFEPNIGNIENKYLNMVVKEELENRTIGKNLRLVSFELISKELDDPNSTEMVEKRKKIEKIMSMYETYPKESVKKALEMSGVFLEESSVDFLYL